MWEFLFIFPSRTGHPVVFWPGCARFQSVEECMKRFLLAMITLLFALAVGLKAQEKPPLKLVETIPLPGLKDGDFDHFAADLEGHRLFLTGEENDKLEILDTKTNQRLHTMQEI